MSKNNNKHEEDYTNVVLVSNPTELPYVYIPYYSIARARINHPTEKLYVFEPGKPAGYKIVAFPIVMQKPEKEEEIEEVINAES